MSKGIDGSALLALLTTTHCSLLSRAGFTSWVQLYWEDVWWLWSFQSLGVSKAIHVSHLWLHPLSSPAPYAGTALPHIWSQWLSLATEEDSIPLSLILFFCLALKPVHGTGTFDYQTRLDLDPHWTSFTAALIGFSFLGTENSSALPLSQFGSLSEWGLAPRLPLPLFQYQSSP